MMHQLPHAKYQSNYGFIATQHNQSTDRHIWGDYCDITAQSTRKAMTLLAKMKAAIKRFYLRVFVNLDV